MTFEQLGSTTVWRGGFFSVEELRMRGERGEFTRHVVRHPGAVGVVPVDGHEAVLIRLFRPALGRSLLEIPAGKLDQEGEEPLHCARRELAEEMGMTARHWEHLTTFVTSPGFSDESLHLYLADGLDRADPDPQGEEEAEIEPVRVPLAEVPAMVGDGRLADAKTIIGLLMAMSRREAPT